MSEGHDKYSPSRLAFLGHCLDWQGEERSDDADEGAHIHSLIEHIATDKAIEASREDIAIADRALKWLASLGPYDWVFEKRIPGVVQDTGGTIDAYAYDAHSKCLIIVDWKGSLPPADSMQGKAYALNLWGWLDEPGEVVDSVIVYFYNYRDGETCTAQYSNKSNLKSDISALIRRHGSQMGNRRAACAGCSYCAHRATCEVALTTTTTELSALPDTSVMPLADLLEFHTKLKAVMKRAEALESAAKARLMDAARAGNLPGYCVKNKRGNKLEWVDEARALTNVQALLSNHFASAKVVGLLPPSQVKAAVKAALAESYTQEVEQAMALEINQPTYEMLAKEKDK